MNNIALLSPISIMQNLYLSKYQLIFLETTPTYSCKLSEGAQSHPKW